MASEAPAAERSRNGVVASNSGSSAALTNPSDLTRPTRRRGRSSRSGGRAGGNGWYAFGFLLPSVILVALIFVYPVYSLVRMSLFQSLGSLSLYVGFDNYSVVLDDPLFRASVRNNLVL